MKILKKIGIGFLALIICFCSCFKFVNAEILNEPFSFETDKEYTLAVHKTYNELNNSVIAYTGDDSIYLYYFYNNNNPYIRYETSNDTGTIIHDIELNYLYNDNNFIYYTFTYYAGLVLGPFYYDGHEFYHFDTSIDIPKFSVYDTIYNLVETYIFGGSIERGSHQDLTATILSSIVCVLVFALPFLIIWKVIKVIMG